MTDLTKVWSLSDAIKGATIQFTSSILGKTSVISAIDMLCFIARNTGAQNPQLTKVYGNDETEAEAYAAELFFDVLGGKMSVARFVEQVMIHTAVQVAYENEAKALAKVVASASA